MTIHRIRTCKCGHEETVHDGNGCHYGAGIAGAISCECEKFRTRGSFGSGKRRAEPKAQPTTALGALKAAAEFLTLAIGHVGDWAAREVGDYFAEGVWESWSRGAAEIWRRGSMSEGYIFITESYGKYGVWITDVDGSRGRWLTENINSTVWRGSLSEARRHVDVRASAYTDTRYKVCKYRDLAETHEEVKQLRDRNKVLEKIAAAVVHYREMCVRPHLYSSVQRNGRLSLEELDKLLLGFEVKK